MDLSMVLSIVAGIGFTTAFVTYNWDVFTSKTTPNGSSWVIWSLVALVSTPSYIVASGDWWKSVIPLLNILLCIGTFVLVLFKGKFKKPELIELGPILLSIIAVVIWKKSGSAAIANLIVNGAILIGFLPTFRGIWKRIAKEHPTPWWIWTASYVVAGVVVILRWKEQWIDLVYPINCILLHAVLLFLIWERSRKFLGKFSGKLLRYDGDYAVCWINEGCNDKAEINMPAYQFRHYKIAPGSLFEFDGYLLVKLVTPEQLRLPHDSTLN